jgi:serine/threonine protein kinase
MRQCCKSLAEAHKAGIIHRDLKPDNIFLVDIEGERDFAKVLDFGVAKLKEFEGKDGTLTQAGMIFGTPKYMSPEQARSGNLDARSDVYALGIIMYEMLMGKPPFSADNPLSILISHVNEQPRRFAQFNPGSTCPRPWRRWSSRP